MVLPVSTIPSIHTTTKFVKFFYYKFVRITVILWLGGESMKKKHKKMKARVSNPVAAATNSMVTEGRGEILSDILGSYTGTAQDDQVPEQDADDL